MLEQICNICSDVAPHEQYKIESALKQVRLFSFRPGTVLYSSGSPFKGAYLVKNGLVKSFTKVDDGEVLTCISLANDVLGMDSLYSEYYESTATAAVQTEAIWIPLGCLTVLLKISAQFRMFVLEALGRAISENSLFIYVLSNSTAAERVAYLLLKFYYAHQHSDGIANKAIIALSRMEMADHLGLSFETVSRKLSLLHRLGHVRLSGRKIHIQDVAALKHICGSIAFPE